MSADPHDAHDPTEQQVEFIASGFHPAINEERAGTQRLATSAIRRAPRPRAPLWPWIATGLGAGLILIISSRMTFCRPLDGVVSAQAVSVESPDSGYLLEYLAPTGARLRTGDPLAALAAVHDPVDMYALTRSLSDETREFERLKARLAAVEAALRRSPPEGGKDTRGDLEEELAMLAPGDPRGDVLRGWIRDLAAGGNPRSASARRADLAQEADVLAHRIAGAAAAVSVARHRLDGAARVTRDARTIVAAPADGTLIRRSAVLGTHVDQGQAIATFALDAATVVVALSSDDLQIPAGSRCWLRLVSGGPVVDGWTEELAHAEELQPPVPSRPPGARLGIHLAGTDQLAPRLGERIRVLIDGGSGASNSLMRWLATRLWL